jgi:hypothetical protein
LLHAKEKKKEGKFEHVEKFGIKKGTTLACIWGRRRRRRRRRRKILSFRSLPPLSVHVVSGRCRPVFSFLSLLSGILFDPDSYVSRAILVRTIVAQKKKKFRSFVLESFSFFVDSSAHHYPPELCDVSRAALWLDRGRACAGAWVAVRMNREYAQGVANEQLV